ncbi:MAG: site-specific integrase [Nitrospirae bacterium]|nr:site-specific integrase [Nitrospirota bacterium]
MNGRIRCLKCATVMDTHTCPKCGYGKCRIFLYWRKKLHRFSTDKDGVQLDYMHAERQLTIMRADIDRKRFIPDDWIPGKVKEKLVTHKLDEWIEQKAEEEASNEFSPETLRHYKSYSRAYYKPFFKGIDCREVKFEQLERFKDKLPKKLKLKTKRNILNALHSFFSWLRRKGVIPEIPLFPQIKGNDATVRLSIDYEEQLAALKRIPSEDRDVFEFGFETCLRPGETTALKVKDIDLRNQQILIQRSWSYGKLRETTKSGKKVFLPLSDKAYEIAKRNTEGKTPDTFLFVNPTTNGNYTQDSLQVRWKKFSGLPVCHYEASRHSFITQMVENDTNPLVAKALARHADIRTTQKYYHATTAKLRDIVNRRGRVVKIDEHKPKKDTNE